ncbi:S1 family peptidase [Bosea beijingensis]
MNILLGQKMAITTIALALLGDGQVAAQIRTPSSCGMMPAPATNTTMAARLSPRMVESRPATAGELPIMASLARTGADNAADRHRCGAVFVSSHRLLTAAHCLAYSDAVGRPIVYHPDYLRVIVTYSRSLQQQGENRDQYREMRVESYTCLSGWNGNWRAGNDLAVLRLYEPAPRWVWERPGGKPPVLIPRDAAADERLVPFGSNVVAAGWGTTSPQGGASAEQMRVGDMVRLSSDRCSGPRDAICFGPRSGSTATCAGDSGGLGGVEQPDGQFLLLGIASGGPDRCGGVGSRNDVMTRISQHSDWIARMLGGDIIAP